MQPQDLHGWWCWTLPEMCTSSSWPSSWFREGRQKLQCKPSVWVRSTALRKPEGGVGGIVVGNAVRRLTSRTVAQQLGKAALPELVASALRTHYRR